MATGFRRVGFIIMAKTPRLKVFRTQIGIHDWLVAAPSQKAALKAWDVRENLFASGAAEEVKDPDAISLALKTPGQPVAVRARKAGAPSKSGNVVPLHHHPPQPRPAPKPAPAPKKDRSKLDAAENALARHELEAKRARRDGERKVQAAQDDREALDAKLQRERKALEERVERAQRAYDAKD